MFMWNTPCETLRWIIFVALLLCVWEGSYLFICGCSWHAENSQQWSIWEALEFIQCLVCCNQLGRLGMWYHKRQRVSGKITKSYHWPTIDLSLNKRSRVFAVNHLSKIGGQEAIIDTSWAMIGRKAKIGFVHTEQNTVHMTTNFGTIIVSFACKIISSFFFRFRVHAIGHPYVVYTIKVTLQQLDFERDTFGRNLTNNSSKVWKTIGHAYVGPQMEAQNIPEVHKGNSSSPQVWTFLL